MTPQLHCLFQSKMSSKWRRVGSPLVNSRPGASRPLITWCFHGVPLTTLYSAGLYCTASFAPFSGLISSFTSWPDFGPPAGAGPAGAPGGAEGGHHLREGPDYLEWAEGLYGDAAHGRVPAPE